MIMVMAGDTTLRTGVNVGYSDEFRDRETNTALLQQLANLPARQGEAGRLLPPLPLLPDDTEKADQALAPQLKIDPYRRDLPKATAQLDIWHWLVLAASCIFFADVFVRRVQLDFQWLVPIWARFAEVVLGRERQEASPEMMSRLRSRKAEVDRSLESRRAAARFEPDAEGAVDPNALSAAEAKPTTAGPTTVPMTKPKVEAETEDSYTSRLLRVKKEVWKDRAQDKGFDPESKEDF
jgi:hypothetical protein